MTRESERNSRFSRREFLAATGGLGVAGLAGCTQDYPSDGAPDGPTDVVEAGGAGVADGEEGDSGGRDGRSGAFGPGFGAVGSLLAALVEGEPAVVRLAIGWGVAVTGFTLYWLVRRGHLPMAESVAKMTGLHERIGPDPGSHEPRNEE
jgi:hypothetical protein